MSAKAPDTRRAARPRGQARREALLDAVLTIVAATGADAVTHRKVAEVAGLPLASTTYWFSSKEDLLAAALELAAERDTVALAQRAEELAGTNPLDAIAPLILGPLAGGLEHSRASRGSLTAAYALWLEGARRPRLRAVAEEWTAAYQRATAELMARAGDPDANESARLLVAAADGLLVEQLASGGDSDLAAPLRRLAGALAGAR
jgi:DNA-binding transcriptional regulator YbjK